MTLFGLVGGYWMNATYRQRAAVRRFYALTAEASAQRDKDLVTMGYRHQGRDDYYKPIVPKWQHPLRDLIGEESFGEVTGVQLTDTATTDDDLRHLASVPTVERIWLDNTEVTDEGLKLLRVCRELRFLTLSGTAITDRGVAELAAHHGELDTLSLNNTKITDAALDDLARLPKLKHLWLRGAAITDAGYLRLQAALPECEIQADVPAYFRKVQSPYW